MALLRTRVSGEVEHTDDGIAVERQQEAAARVVGVARDHRRDLLGRRRRVAREQLRQPLGSDRGAVGGGRPGVGRWPGADRQWLWHNKPSVTSYRNIVAARERRRVRAACATN